jgi:hypothetical protein
MPWTRLTVLIAAIVVTSAASVVAETMSDCTESRIEARTRLRAESDLRHQACRGNRQCLAKAEAWWQAATKQVDDARAACNARVRSAQKREPPPWANWKPGDPPPCTKDGQRCYLMSCSGKVLGMFRPGGALELELNARGGSCHPAESWGQIKMNPGPTSEWGYCRDGSWGHRSNGCVHASPPR